MSIFPIPSGFKINFNNVQSWFLTIMYENFSLLISMEDLAKRQKTMETSTFRMGVSVRAFIVAPITGYVQRWLGLRWISFYLIWEEKIATSKW